MLIFSLPLLILTASYNYPKISFLYVTEDASEMYWDVNDALDVCYEMPSNQQAECLAFFNSVVDVLFSTGNNVNKKLEEVSKSTEKLYVIIEDECETIDFNSLKFKTVVHLISYKNSNLAYLSRIEKIKISFIKQLLTKTRKQNLNDDKANSIQFKHASNTKSTRFSYTIYIKGNIYNKVSFLIISSLTISFDGSARCENIYLNWVTLRDDSSSIEANNLIIDDDSYDDLGYLYKVPQIDVDQFSLNLVHSTLQQHHIAYIQDGFRVKRKDSEMSDFPDSSFFVPYSFAKKFSFISYASYICIEASYKYLTNYVDLNLTISKEGIPISPPFLFSSQTVQIETIGFSEEEGFDQSKKPSVSVVYAKSDFTIDKTKSDLYIEEKPPYSQPQNPSQEDNPGKDDSDDDSDSKGTLIEDSDIMKYAFYALAGIEGIVALVGVIIIIVIAINIASEVKSHRQGR